MALWTFIVVDLFYFIMCEAPHEWKFNEIAFGWGSGHIRLHTTLEDPWPHYMILEVSWDGLWTLSFGLSQSLGHGSWRVWKWRLAPHVMLFVPLISFYFFFVWPRIINSPSLNTSLLITLQGYWPTLIYIHDKSCGYNNKDYDIKISCY